MHALIWLVNAVLSLAWWIIIIHVIMSWLIAFNVVNLYQPFVRQVWEGLTRLTEPMYRPVRRILPNMGGLDLSPLIVLLAITFLQIFFNQDVVPALIY